MKLKIYLINNIGSTKICEKDFREDEVDNIIERIKKQGYKIKELEFIYVSHCVDVVSFNELVHSKDKSVFLRLKGAW